jgi:hypothetical protein
LDDELGVLSENELVFELVVSSVVLLEHQLAISLVDELVFELVVSLEV